MRASRPAAWAALAVLHLLLDPSETLVAGFLAFGRRHPADPLVAGEFGQAVPLGIEVWIAVEDSAKLVGRFVAEVCGRFRQCSGRFHRLELEPVPDFG